MSEQDTFIGRCLSGHASPADIDDWVDTWHGAPAGPTLAEYIGMSQEEYSVWVERPGALPFILRAHRFKVSLSDVLTGSDEDVRIAARAPASARQELIAWLKKTGRL